MNWIMEMQKCKPGEYYCYTDKKCKKIPMGWHIARGGYIEKDDEESETKKNGNGGSNGNGNGNGNGGGGAVSEAAVSRAQQRFFGMVRAAQKGEMENPSTEVSKAATSMSKSDVKKFAKTKHKGLPDKKEVKEALRSSILGDRRAMKKIDDNEKKNKEQDARMKYGKNWKKFTSDVDAAKNRLRKGEVKKFNKETGKWESNKD